MPIRLHPSATAVPQRPAPVPADPAEAKRTLRWARWNGLREAGAARFPGVAGRIPNFVGAEAAAERLAGERCWTRARTVACTSDLPQRPVRARALREGKVVVMPVPKLATAAPFVRLDPARIPSERLWDASSLGWAVEHGEPAPLEELESLDLYVLGSVAVTPDGARLGKGGGHGDLVYALLREAGRLGARVPLATTVHPTQVVADGGIPMLPHDVPVDRIATADGVRPCPRTHPRPRGLLWSALTPTQVASMPVLLARSPDARARAPSTAETPREGARRRKA